MAEENVAPQTITIDGTEHELASFSIEVQRLVSIHQKWEQKLAEPDFYSKPGANADLKKYGDLKADLAKVYGEWESAVEKLGWNQYRLWFVKNEVSTPVSLEVTPHFFDLKNWYCALVGVFL